jgi:hypothetical protein
MWAETGRSPPNKERRKTVGCWLNFYVKYPQQVYITNLQCDIKLKRTTRLPENLTTASTSSNTRLESVQEPATIIRLSSITLRLSNIHFTLTDYNPVFYSLNCTYICTNHIVRTTVCFLVVKGPVADVTDAPQP